MRLFIGTILAVSLFTQSVSGFVPIAVTKSVMVLNAVVDLKPEPAGGEEIVAVKSMDGSRMKNMGVAEGVKNDDGIVYKFWLMATAQGDLIKELNAQVLKNASKKANFPGFRKVRLSEKRK